VNLLAAHTDNALRRLADAGDRAALDELARRGLISTPETLAALRETRKAYRRLACLGGKDWGYTGRRSA
jgi:hypothetical protein